MRILLASGSPRRRSLLETLGHQVDVLLPTACEDAIPGEPPEALVVRLALAKAASVTAPAPETLPLIAADTVVVLDGTVLGKPDHHSTAAEMLTRLSGREHRVLTGFCVRCGGREVLGSVESRVVFRQLDRAAIDAYVSSGEPSDKAGAYGIQGMGAALVREVRGSYSNVVGLPLDEVLAACD